MANSCWDCENLGKSVYMEYEGETLYNCWCKVGCDALEDCDKFAEVKTKNEDVLW